MMYKNNAWFIRVFMLIILCALTATPAIATPSDISDKALEKVLRNTKQVIIFNKSQTLTYAELKGDGYFADAERKIFVTTWKTSEDWKKEYKTVNFYDMNVYEKNKSGEWRRIMYAPSCVAGKNVDDLEGVFHCTKAFGVNKILNYPIDYTLLDETYYWCEDPQSPHFNQLVSISKYRDFDIKKSKWIHEFPNEYAYCLVIEKDDEIKSDSTKTLFLQCRDENSSYEHTGSIAIPQKNMQSLFKRLKKNSVIIIE